MGAKYKREVSQCLSHGAGNPGKLNLELKTEPKKPGLICNTLGYLLAVCVRDRLQENVVVRVHMVPHYKNIS